MTFSQEPLGQFQPKLVGNILGGWRFRFVKKKTMLGPNKENFDKSPHELLT